MRRILIVFGVTLVVMLFVFRSADWYASNAALPRFCGNPNLAITHVRMILTKATPVGDEKKLPFILAAKLIFLFPQQDQEGTEAYLERLRQLISQKCGVAY